MKDEQPLPHEELRQIILEQHKDEIEEIAVKVATELYPDRDFEATVDQLKALIAKKLETLRSPEDKLFLMPTTERVS